LIWGPDFNIERNGRSTGSQLNSKRGEMLREALAEGIPISTTTVEYLTYIKPLKTNHKHQSYGTSIYSAGIPGKTNVSVQGIPVLLAIIQ